MLLNAWLYTRPDRHPLPSSRRPLAREDRAHGNATAANLMIVDSINNATTTTTTNNNNNNNTNNNNKDNNNNNH